MYGGFWNVMKQNLHWKWIILDQGSNIYENLKVKLDRLIESQE